MAMTADVVKEGQFRYLLTHEFGAGVEYQVGIGIGDERKPPVRYRIAVYSNTDHDFPADPKCPPEGGCPRRRDSQP